MSLEDLCNLPILSYPCLTYTSKSEQHLSRRSTPPPLSVDVIYAGSPSQCMK